MHSTARFAFLILSFSLGGWRAVGAEATTLAPVVVDEPSLARRLQYFEVSGFQVLSVFSAEKTKMIAEELQRQRALLALIVPEKFHAPDDGVPHTIFLDEQEPHGLPEMRAALQQGRARPPSSTGNEGRDLMRMAEAETRREDLRERMSELRSQRSQIAGWSQTGDEHVVRQSLDAVRGHAGPITGRPAPQVNYLAVRRSEVAAPDRRLAYVNIFGIDFRSIRPGAGLTSLELLFPLAALHYGRTPRWPGWLEDAVTGNDGDPTSLLLRRRFGPKEISVAFLRISIPPPAKFDLEQAFAEPSGETAKTRRAFMQAFVDWAVMQGKPQRAAAFWKFVEQAERAPVTARMFTEHFGADGLKQVLQHWNRVFTPSGVITTDGPRETIFRAAGPVRIQPVTIRQPTRAESVRIRSEYEWRIGREFERGAPELGRQSIDLAGRRLRQAYADGERDPQFLATLALFECDAGMPAVARARLEEAVATHVVRPQLYYELGRARSLEERAALSAPAAKLTIAQRQRILDPLIAARTQRPALAAVYHLACETWMSSAEPPDRSELASLAEGAAKFPRDAELAEKVAALHAQAGLTTEAATIAEQGLVWPQIDAGLRARLEKLRSSGDKDTRGIPPGSK